MTRGLFVTGTDTGAGKTWLSAGCLWALRQQGLRVVGFKPVASGARMTAAGLRNADAEILRGESNADVPYELINPYCFAPPVAPHIAAAECQQFISFDRIECSLQTLQRCADAVIVEGVGGWRVPLGENDNALLSDLAGKLNLPVVLVVGLRLGCINQALLSAEAIRSDGVPFVGWVAAHIDPQYDRTLPTLQCLEQRLAAPPLAVVPWIPEFRADRIGAHLAGLLNAF